jgi:hypothetical protein
MHRHPQTARDHRRRKRWPIPAGSATPRPTERPSLRWRWPRGGRVGTFPPDALPPFPGCATRLHSRSLPSITVLRFHLPLLLALLVPFVARGQAEWRSALYPAELDTAGGSAIRNRQTHPGLLLRRLPARGGGTSRPGQGPRFDATAYGADPTGTADSTVRHPGGHRRRGRGGRGRRLPASGNLSGSLPKDRPPTRCASAPPASCCAGPVARLTFLFNTATAMRGKVHPPRRGFGVQLGHGPVGQSATPHHHGPSLVPPP